MQNQITRGESLNRAALRKGFSQLADSLIVVVNSSDGFSRRDKEDFLRNISGWPLILENIASRQSKLRNAKIETNGQETGQEETGQE